MMRTTPYHWGPVHTPSIVRQLIILTCIIAIMSALTDNIFVNFIGTIGPQKLLGLSWEGMRHYFYWQPMTYLFVQDNVSQGLHFFYLLSLVFNMYILWVLGSSLQESFGTYHFLGIYLICGILAGLAALLVMPLVDYTAVLTGPGAALLALFMIWVMCYPDSELMLFFVMPVQTKWLLASIVGAIVVLCLMRLDLVYLVHYLSGIIFGYLYGLIVFDLRSPFTSMLPFERAFLRRLNRILGRKDHRPHPWIYTFPSGTPINDDDAFVDEMLGKIAKYGEESLTPRERQRMEEISLRKRRPKGQ